MLQSIDQKAPVIAGPCALESREQLRRCVAALHQLGVGSIRASLWKPRTQPGWEGLGAESLPILLEETLPYGLVPATEIITAEHACIVRDTMKAYGEEARILVWLGARNQNHLEQQKIARILSEGTSGITLMFKNQMWEDERHWVGIYEHLVSAGFPKERLMSCHRGFSPGKLPNPHHLRNLPDYEMAMRVKERLGIPMLLDPSHIGGSQANVLRVMEEAKAYAFDGYLIEVHASPEEALTDKNQQLGIAEFAALLPGISAA